MNNNKNDVFCKEETEINWKEMIWKKKMRKKSEIKWKETKREKKRSSLPELQYLSSNKKRFWSKCLLTAGDGKRKNGNVS